VHPDWCGKSIGTRLLQMVGEWWFGLGMQALQLDVAATNQRAVGCYRKAGFAFTGEFWREAPDLQCVDINDSQYDFLRDHVRFSGHIPEIRFYWMRRIAGAIRTAPGICVIPGGMSAHQQGEKIP
jgi:RimJ/RimL family protein N-acetyltransferase